MVRNTKNVSVNDVQGYLARGAEIHPHLHYSFLKNLAELEIARKLSLLPHTRLELYSIRVAHNITRRLAA